MEAGAKVLYLSSLLIVIKNQPERDRHFCIHVIREEIYMHKYFKTNRQIYSSLQNQIRIWKEFVPRPALGQRRLASSHPMTSCP
jgi:hypothetical protein